MKKLTQEEFIAKAKLIHPQYNYSKVEYINVRIKVTIICPIHGEFKIIPSNLLSGLRCSKCMRIHIGNLLRSNTEEFIAKAKLIHPQYDYSKVEYINCNLKVKIICSKHGEFEIRASNLLQGMGCRKCFNESKSYTTEEFIAKAKLIHPQYDYSKVEYINSYDKVKIICSKHGEFEIRASYLLKGHGCRKCGCDVSGFNKRSCTEEFIAKAKLIHPQYDYSKVEYIRNDIKVKIICPIHGEYEVIPNSLLRGSGCRRCYVSVNTTEEFIAKAKLIHPQYDYSKVEYINCNLKVKIICSKHGEFEIRASYLLKGRGCRKCFNESKSYTTEEFITKVKLIHPQYDYSKVEYINCKLKVKIICSKHGEFEIRPNTLLNGSGCSICNESKGEKKIAKWLDANNIEYIREKKFHTCKYKRPLPFDFYIESKNILIEFDGEQHFRCRERWGGVTALQLIQYRDSIKTEWASANGYNLIRLDYRMTDNEISEALVRSLA